MKIYSVRFISSAIVQTKGTKDSAGFDLYSVEDVTISSNSIKIIKTDIGFKIRKAISEKSMQGLAHQLDARRLVDASLMPTTEDRLLSSILTFLTRH